MAAGPPSSASGSPSSASGSPSSDASEHGVAPSSTLPEPERSVLALGARSPSRFSSVPAVGDLEAGSVLRLALDGFAHDVTGSIAQCVWMDGQLAECTNRYPVRFDAAGWAQVQYQLTLPTASAGSCRSDVNPCFVVVDDGEGGRSLAQTLFGRPVPEPATVTVSPSASLRQGDEVTVRVAGYPAGVEVFAVQCAPPGEWGQESCGGERVPVVIGADGEGQAVLEVAEGRFGVDAGTCGPDAVCGISVASDDVLTRASTARIAFRPGPGAAYPVGRTLAAASVAVALLSVAAWLWRRTDWSAPSEAATPLMDAAEID